MKKKISICSTSSPELVQGVADVIKNLSASQHKSVDFHLWACHFVAKWWPLQFQTLCSYNDQSRKVIKGAKVGLFTYLSVFITGENWLQKTIRVSLS